MAELLIKAVYTIKKDLGTITLPKPIKLVRLYNIVNVYNYKEKTLYSTKYNTRAEAFNYYNFLIKKN